jgi:hypothetical protein
MASISGITVELQVGPDSVAASPDPLFLGLYGPGGGREFRLDAPTFEEFNQAGKSVRLQLGTGCCPKPNDRQVSWSSQGHGNDPSIYGIDLDGVEFVYLRKQLLEGKPQDNILVLQWVDVRLCDGSEIRRFGSSGRLWFGLETGGTHWLAETDQVGCRISVTLLDIEYAGNNIGDEIALEFKAAFDISQNGHGLVQPFYEIKKGGWPYKTNFDHGETRVVNAAGPTLRTRECCGQEHDLVTWAKVTDYDWPFGKDEGDEDMIIGVTCPPSGTSTIEDTLTIVVDPPNRKPAEFHFRYRVVATCLGTASP